MNILLDTNVLFDLFRRKNNKQDSDFEKNAKEILRLCYEQKIIGYAAANSFTTMMYLLEIEYKKTEKQQELEEQLGKKLNKDELNELWKKQLLSLMKIIKIIGINESFISNALQNFLFADSEDALQAECAKFIEADFIVTRNCKDFSNSTIKSISPKDFLEQFV